MRYLGIDFGEKRNGVAVSDDEARLAVPVGVVQRHNDYDSIAELREMALQRDAGALVVGRPTRLDGQPGSLAERVERFAERLSAACRLPLFFIDETLTSVEAERQSRDVLAHRTGLAGRDEPVDAVAAGILLQDWLDQERRAADGPQGGARQ